MSVTGTVFLHVQQGDCGYYSTVSGTLSGFLTLDLKDLMEAVDSEGKLYRKFFRGAQFYACITGAQSQSQDLGQCSILELLHTPVQGTQLPENHTLAQFQGYTKASVQT